MPVLQQGTSLHGNSPCRHAGEEQAQQVRGAEQGSPLSPVQKGPAQGWDSDGLQKEYSHIGWVCKDGGRQTLL